MFRLKRPQPSLLLMLASGFTPIYAAHVPPASYRTGCIGTGPFKLKEWRARRVRRVREEPGLLREGAALPGRTAVPGHRERGTATAALQTRRVDVAFPGDTSKTIADQLKRAVPSLSVTPVGTAVVDHIAHQHDAAALRQCEGAQGAGPGHRSPRADRGGLPGRRGDRRGHGAQTARRVGIARERGARPARLRPAGRRKRPRPARSWPRPDSAAATR